jgi:hypothetical protein
VSVTNTGNGPAVAAKVAGRRTAVEITSTGHGSALTAAVDGTQAALATTNSGTGLALSVKSANGRGASFAGSAAQITLIPASGASHPASGQTGDVYLDKHARLWLCKSGGSHATWVQLA